MRLTVQNVKSCLLPVQIRNTHAQILCLVHMRGITRHTEGGGGGTGAISPGPYEALALLPSWDASSRSFFIFRSLLCTQ